MAPVIEPVKTNTRDLVRCASVLGAARINTCIVVNPVQGDFKQGEGDALRDELAVVFEEHPLVLPTFLCRQGVGFNAVAQFLRNYAGRDVALIYWNPAITETNAARLASERQIRFNISLFDQMPEAIRSVLPRQTLVGIRDHFRAQARNSDYEGMEFFSDSHLNVNGQAGYGDFLTIGSEYHEGGGPAFAVAIHATFKQPGTRQIWVEHFVSDDVEKDVGSVGEKFLQAARKLVRAVRRRRNEFGDNIALRAYAKYVRTNVFPGLPKNKQHQIEHHICLNHQILSDEL